MIDFEAMQKQAEANIEHDMYEATMKRMIDALSLRHFYAGLAMQGFLSNPRVEDYKSLAKSCFKMADAMIKEGKA